MKRMIAFATIMARLVMAVQNGTAVQDSTLYPYFVSLGNPHVCGGAFLSLEPEAWVITAAHCVYDASLPPPSPNPYFVSFGDVSRPKQQIGEIANWIVHPDYATESGETDMRYDVALVKLKNPVKESPTVSRVALFKDNATVDEGTVASVMGVGYTGYKKPQPSEILHMLVKVKKYVSGGSNMIETTPPAYSGVCHGDSGGPLITRSPWTGQPYVLGVLSRIFSAYDPDPGNATCPLSLDNKSNVSTDGYVNTAHFLSWISNNTGIAINDLTSPSTTAAAWDAGRMQSVLVSTGHKLISSHMVMVTCIFIFNLFYHIV